MSCEWTIKCTDCNEVPEEINNANHQLGVMQYLVANAELLRGLYLAATKGGEIYGFEITLNYCVPAPIEFLVKHAGHRLRPYNEYGQYDTPCKEKFWCHLCNAIVECNDLEHPNRKKHSHAFGHTSHYEQLDETTIQTKG